MKLLHTISEENSSYFRDWRKLLLLKSRDWCMRDGGFEQEDVAGNPQDLDVLTSTVAGCSIHRASTHMKSPTWILSICWS